MRRWNHWTLRARLVLVVGVLAAVALISANVAGLLLIRSYLGDRIDDQLRGMSRMLSKPPPEYTVSREANGLRYSHYAHPDDSNPLKKVGPDQVIYRCERDGTLIPGLSSSADLGRPPIPVSDDVVTGEPYTVEASDGSAQWRMIAVANTADDGFTVAGVSLAEVDQTTDQLLLIDLGVSVLVLGLLGLGAASVVRLGLRPLNAMERLATDISAGNLSGRVADTDPHTEPGRLGLALNSMLGRIEAEVGARTASERRMRQFLADASHELRTPLTSIRGFAELYRRGGVTPGPALDRIESEAGRMSVLVEDMLMLARLDQQRPLARGPVDLLEIAADTISDAHARAPERIVRLAGLRDDEETFEPATVLGDAHALRQVATNLVANALQHTPKNARVTVRVGVLPARSPNPGSVVSGPVSVAAGGEVAVLEVSDDGPGIAAEHAPRVFERLYRADSSRFRGKGGGSGLGLSIAAALVQGHGGWIELDPATGSGATFRVVLPVAL
ncbi:HAMP domain-containing sensor histidine kinase [Actinoplanes sp. Pm04-4]|uniref:histidine kinase n=1 Tax=Paractinoplanes pyxinae TaxID=2997416 RepID=A0ABT4BDE3_9ACTN|nr:HAMP domain-containing sensor histidine kinase [Actinoplanes pyxinae]MCY1144536.1 HAMP domain-containing sensor histidine kinase [Actinoplanes pyxinae]